MRWWLIVPVVLAALLVGCHDAPDRPRRMQTVKLLPDTPPPPPPKPEEKPPEPKPQEQRPEPQPQPQPDQKPPETQALKTDEAAGDGPGSGLVAGNVRTDYAGQAIGGALEGGGVAAAAAQTYANALTRSINDYLARERNLRRADYKVRVLVWLTPAGGIERVELAEGTGDAETDSRLRAALARYPGSKPPPERLPQPLRLQVTNRMIG